MGLLIDLATALQPWAGPIGGALGSLFTLFGILAKQKADARKLKRDSAVDERTFTQVERDALIREAAEYRKELRADLDRAMVRLDDCESSRTELRSRIEDLDGNMHTAMIRIGELESQLTAAGLRPSPFNPQ